MKDTHWLIWNDETNPDGTRDYVLTTNPQEQVFFYQTVIPCEQIRREIMRPVREYIRRHCR